MSRPKERIPIFWNLVDGRIGEILEMLGYNANLDSTQDIVESIYDREFELIEFWNLHPDLRFTQVLVNLNIIPNNPGFWYYMEENEILQRLGLNVREYLLWGQRYDKDMNLLPEVVYKTISHMDTGHIKAIIDGGWCRSETYLDCFKEELKLRGHG